jgi:hypothetical protein
VVSSLWLSFLVVSTNGSLDLVSPTRTTNESGMRRIICSSEKLGADSIPYNMIICKVMRASSSHRLLDMDIAGTRCTWKKHHSAPITVGIRIGGHFLLDHDQGLGRAGKKGWKISCVVADPKGPSQPNSGEGGIGSG